VDACKFPVTGCKVSYMCLELITNNQPQCIHIDFDPKVVEESSLKSMICFIIAQEGMILFVWTNIPISRIFLPKPKQKKWKYSKAIKRKFIIAFFIFPGDFLIQESVAHAGVFLGRHAAGGN